MRRPWNIIDTPVYSLATYDDRGVNMNICTYVTAISMQPKLYLIAIVPGSETHHRLKNANTAILQLLSDDNLRTVRSLGKKSGKTFDKHTYLIKNNLLTEWKGKQVLQHACAYLYLEQVAQIETIGDHDLFTFKLLHSRTCSEDNILTFQKLVAKGVILS